jgi:hypothetical protein
MAWPTTKAGTTNLDSSGDDPNLARPDIKQNIENVNDIIDFFPNGVNLNLVVLEMTGVQVSTGASAIQTLSEHYDPGGYATLSDSDTQFTLSSGTYIMEHEAFAAQDAANQRFMNKTTDTAIVSGNATREIGTSGDVVVLGLNNTVFTSNGTDKFGFNYNEALNITTTTLDGLRIKFTKLN